jgi:CheY-like chemotaxis protein
MGKILLAEKNSSAAMEIIFMLRARGCKVDRATDGKMVLEMYQADHYDLILMNTWLPDKTSMEITCAIRAQEAIPNGKFTPIIGIFSDTGKNTPVSYKKYFRAGMNDVLPQPLSAEILDRILEKYLFHV